MKRLLIGSTLAVIAAAAGCDRAGSAGGPGAAGSSAKAPLYGQANETFNLTASSVSLQQGDATPGTIGIKRGTNFGQDVAITFSDLPQGVTLDPAKPVITSQATEAKFNLTAGNDAALGEFTIKVTGHPTTGADATNQFTLTVAKKDTFSLSMPFWTTALKQGETKAAAISIVRDKRFDQDVSLKFEGLPKGITVEPADSVIKTGQSEAKFMIKAADDAAVGDFTAKVIGHPKAGADASHEFKFSVGKK